MLTIEPRTYPPVTRLQLIKYAGASGDFNPIHTVDDEAYKAGLPGVIAHGMLTMGWVANLFSPYQSYGMMLDFTTRFKNKVFVGDEITARAEWEKSEESEGGTIHFFRVAAENQHKQVVAMGNAAFLIYS